MHTILIVDDEETIHIMLSRVLSRQGYHTESANDGTIALQSVAANPPDLILMDLGMPGVDGFEVARKIKQDPETRDLPIILMTGMDTVDNHVKALDMGIDDFLSKRAAPSEIVARVRLHLKSKQLNDEMKIHRDSLEKEVMLRTQQLDQALGQLRTASLDTIFRLTAASEYKDNETGTHIKRMSHYCAAIASRMGLKPSTVENILYAAPMHDIGKIGIPDKILLKPDQLTGREWELMKQHTIIGADILKGAKIGFVRLGEIIALTHHEKWDGSGYPYGLKGRRIPLIGRIAALADVFDALTSARPYKKAFSIEKSIGIIRQERGRHFDPDVVDAFLSIQEKVLKIKATYQEDRQSLLHCLNDLSDDCISALG